MSVLTACGRLFPLIPKRWILKQSQRLESQAGFYISFNRKVLLVTGHQSYRVAMAGFKCKARWYFTNLESTIPLKPFLCYCRFTTISQGNTWGILHPILTSGVKTNAEFVHFQIPCINPV